MSEFGNLWAESIALPFAQRWWTVALRGVFALVFGLFALLAPGATVLSLVLLFAVYALMDGVAELYLAARCVGQGVGWRRWAPVAIGGLASLAAAAVALLWPGVTVVVFVLLLAFWSFVSGVMMIASSIWLVAGHGRPWLALAGAISVLFGMALAVAPFLGAVVLTWWIGAYALAFAASMFALAYRLRARRLDRSPAASAR